MPRRGKGPCPGLPRVSTGARIVEMPADGSGGEHDAHELANVASAVPFDALAAALSTFTDRERRALLSGDMGSATAAMECRLVCGVELDRRTGRAAR